MATQHISDHYSAAENQVRQQIYNFKNNENIVGNSEEYKDALFVNNALKPIELTGKENNDIEVRRLKNQSDGWGGVGDRDIQFIVLKLEIKPNNRASEIWKMEGSAILLGKPDVSVENNQLISAFEMKPDWSAETIKRSVESVKNKIQRELDSRRSAIEKGNEELRKHIQDLTASRKAQLEKQANDIERARKLL